MKTSDLSFKSQFSKEPTKLVDYLEERQANLKLQLQSQNNQFMIKESEQEILMQKLKSVNEMMKYLIETDQKFSTQLKNDENYKLLDMVQGTLRKRLVRQNAESETSSNKTVEISRSRLIERCKLKLLQSSKQIKHTVSTQDQPEFLPNGEKIETQAQSLRRRLRKYSTNLQPTEPLIQTKCWYSDNHLHRRQ